MLIKQSLLRTVLLGAGVIYGLSMPVMPAAAQQSMSVQDIKSAVTAKQTDIKTVEKEHKKTQRALTSLQSELVEKAKAQKEIEAQLQKLNDQIDNAQQQKGDMIHSLHQQREITAATISALYHFSQMPSYTGFFSRKSYSEKIHQNITLRTITPELSKQLYTLERDFKKLSELEASLKSLKAENTKKKDKLTQEITAAETLLKERQNLVAELGARIDNDAAELKRLSVKAKTIEELFTAFKTPTPRPATIKQPVITANALPREAVASAALQSNEIPPATVSAASYAVLSAPTPAVENDNAVMPGASDRYPVVGKIKVKYGAQDEIGAKSAGLVFSTHPKSIVTSPRRGTVIFAGPFQNFKQLLIIKHSGGYHSLISGLDRIDAVAGQKLVRGEPIGRVMQDMDSRGRVYYELRKNGKPVNPNSFLRQYKS